MKIKPALLTALMLVTAAAPTAAQENEFSGRVKALAETLGAVHYLRGLCTEDEQTIWRDAMMELIRLEEPSRAQRQEMTRRFNQGYHSARDRFPRCNRDAERESERLAAKGSQTAAELAHALRPRRH